MLAKDKSTEYSVIVSCCCCLSLNFFSFASVFQVHNGKWDEPSLLFPIGLCGITFHFFSISNTAEKYNTLILINFDMRKHGIIMELLIMIENTSIQWLFFSFFVVFFFSPCEFCCCERNSSNFLSLCYGDKKKCRQKSENTNEMPMNLNEMFVVQPRFYDISSNKFYVSHTLARALFFCWQSKYFQLTKIKQDMMSVVIRKFYANE